MKNVCLCAVLLAACQYSMRAEDQIASAFECARSGGSAEKCFEPIDPASINLAREAPALLRVLNGNDSWMARRAAGIVLGTLMMRRTDPGAKRAASRMLPALISHYDDPDPSQPAGFDAPTDDWRQTVMYVLIACDGVPPPALIRKMEADLDRKGDLHDLTWQVAMGALTHLRPIPDGVLDRVLAKMDESARSRLEVVQTLGANHVDGPAALRAITDALESQVGDASNVTPSDLHRAAARALGQIGPAAKDTLPVLRRVASNPDPGADQETKDLARQAIQLIQAQR